MHSHFPKVKHSWWWIQSRSNLERFSADSFAQGYELLRRSPRFAIRLLACNCHPDRSWKQHYRIQKSYFAINYRRVLVALSLHKRIWAGPKGITFDTTLSNDSLLKAFEAEVRQPTPFACGSNFETDTGFCIVPTGFKPHPADKEVYVERPTGVALWSNSRHETQMVHLKLPRYEKYGEDRDLTDREAIAYFRNFIKDSPPPDFAAYRRTFQKVARHKRSLEARPLALGLIAHDYSLLPEAEMADLATWLSATLRAKKLFDLEEPAIQKALYNGKSRVNSLLHRLERL